MPTAPGARSATGRRSPLRWLPWALLLILIVIIAIVVIVVRNVRDDNTSLGAGAPAASNHPAAAPASYLAF